MKLDDGFDDEYDDPLTYNSGRRGGMGTAAIVAVLFILLSIVVVVMVNDPSLKKNGGTGRSNKATPAAVSDWNPDKNATDVISGKKGTAADLDFWDAYPTKGDPTSAAAAASTAAADASESAAAVSEGPTPWGAKAAAETEPELSVSEDGLHTRIVYEDGTEEWAEINQYLSRNTYDASGFVYQKPFMNYYVNNTKRSFAGVDVSKEDGYVDFKLLKRSGVDFVMLRIGQRGYQTGELSMDETFIDNYNRAVEAELEIGAYFVTAAINTEEAKEEADFVVHILAENDMRLSYPVALSAMQLGSGKSRTDEIEKMPRTNNAITFMKTIENAGGFSLLYADKATLLKKYNLSSLVGYDIWYSGDEDVPDYPYQFVMWQYDKGAKVDGIAGGARLNLCFTDYSLR